MLREAAFDPRRLDDYLDQIDRIDPARLKQYEEATGIALARANVDFSGFQQANAEAEERRLMPRYVEEHFIKASRRRRPEGRAAGGRPVADRARPCRPPVRPARRRFASWASRSRPTARPPSARSTSTRTSTSTPSSSAPATRSTPPWTSG